MRRPVLLVALSLALTGARARAGRAEGAGPPPAVMAVERFALGPEAALVVSPAHDAPRVVVCVADRAARPWTAPDPLALARRGGTERRELRGTSSTWCATLPSSEVAFALWVAGHLREEAAPPAETAQSSNAPLDVDPVRRAYSLSLEGTTPTALRDEAAPVRVISVTGDVSVTEVSTLAGRYLGTVSPPRSVLRPDPWSLHQTSERLSVAEGSTKTPEIHYGWVATVAEQDRALGFHVAPLEVALELLAGQDTARLPRLLVSRGLARHVGVWSIRQGGGALFGVVVETTARASIDRVRRFVDGSLKQLRLVGPSAGEVSRAVAVLRRRALETWDDPDARARALAEYELTTGDARRFAEELESVSHATPERVRSAAHEVFVDARRTTIESYPALWPADDPAMARHRLYTVAPGDTLETIAMRFHVDPSRLARDNDVDPRYRLMPGQPLWVAP